MDEVQLFLYGDTFTELVGCQYKNSLKPQKGFFFSSYHVSLQFQVMPVSAFPLYD